jgi:REP-associated tyrosine transposase
LEAAVRVLHPPRRMPRLRRLRHHDYASNARYFLTICTHNRCRLLVGRTATRVERELLALPSRFQGLSVECSKVMPDHLYALLVLSDCDATISAIVQAFKSLSTRIVRRTGATGRVWQRGFHDRIVRRELNLEGLRDYIRNNDVVHAKRRNSNRR